MSQQLEALAWDFARDLFKRGPYGVSIDGIHAKLDFTTLEVHWGTPENIRVNFVVRVGRTKLMEEGWSFEQFRNDTRIEVSS